MTDKATLEARLTEAEEARHKLMIGKAYASFSVDGVSSTTYTRADLGRLDAYISQLRAQIANFGDTRRGRLAPIHFGF